MRFQDNVLLYVALLMALVLAVCAKWCLPQYHFCPLLCKSFIFSGTSYFTIMWSL